MLRLVDVDGVALGELDVDDDPPDVDPLGPELGEEAALDMLEPPDVEEGPDEGVLDAFDEVCEGEVLLGVDVGAEDVGGDEDVGGGVDEEVGVGVEEGGGVGVDESVDGSGVGVDAAAVDEPREEVGLV